MTTPPVPLNNHEIVGCVGPGRLSSCPVRATPPRKAGQDSFTGCFSRGISHLWLLWHRVDRIEDRYK